MNQNEKRLWTQTLWDPLDEKNKSPYESKEPGIRVAAYCRISNSGRGNDSSLINQVQHFTELIYKRDNWKFVGVYIDDKISGATVKYRPGFSRLLRHAEEGRIDLILTKSVSRFCRNTAELIETVNRLKELGVAVYFQNEQLDTSTNYNNFLLECQAAVAQEELDAVSQNVQKSYEHRLQRGKPYYKNMFGYDTVIQNGEKTFIINPDEAEVVRWIYHEFLSGKSRAQITRELNQSGVKTKKDIKCWTNNYVTQVLNEIAYTGDKMTRKRVRDMLTKSMSLNHGQITQYYIENSHPAIISHEVFELACKRMQEVRYNSLREQSVHTKWPFSGRLKCGKCSCTLRRANNNNWICKYALPSVGKCNLYRPSDREIVEMSLSAMFERFVRKGQSREGQSGESQIELNLKNFEFQHFIKQIRKILIRVNENDHFEFHRLKYFNAIEMLDSMNTAEADIKREELRAEYKDFEKRISKIENDRAYRNQSLEWLETIKSMDDFIERMTDEIARAWILDIVVYSKTAYIVKWIDDEETVIGPEEIAEIEKNKWESPGNLKASKPGPPGEVRSFEGVENMGRAEEHDELISYQNAKLVEHRQTRIDEISVVEQNLLVRQDNRHHIKPNNNVIKLEPGMGIETINGIKRKVSQSKATNVLCDRNIKVAAYCRVSTDFEEQKVSMQTQVAYYTYLILKNKNWDFAGIYADEGFSGRNMSERKDFNRMIDDVRKGKIDLIITKSISRFSRNVVNLLEILKMFKELPNKPVVVFEKEGLRSDDEKSSLLITLMSGIAQNELTSLSSNVKWGRMKYAERGIVFRGVSVYGYMIDKHNNWNVIPKEAEVIRYIFDEYIENRSISGIIRKLYEQGIKSPNGYDFWADSTLRDLIKSEKMKGDYRYQKFCPTELTGSGKKLNKGQMPQVYIEKHHEPIVSEIVWARAQEVYNETNKPRIVESREGRSAGRVCYYNRFNCGHCGGTVTRYRGKERDSPEGSTWRCHNSYWRIDTECIVGGAKAEKYLDYYFMRTLEKIRGSSEFRRMVDEVIEKLRLTDDEEQNEKELADEIKSLNQELYEAVEGELSIHGLDTTKINELTEKIIKSRDELILYHNRIEKAESIRSQYNKLMKAISEQEFLNFRDFHNMRPRIKPGQSLYDTTKNAKDRTYVNEKGPDHFREDLFEKYIENGVIYDDGRIAYQFGLGVIFSADMTYQDYKDEHQSAKDEINFEELVNSKEVKKLKKFCKKPKFSKEMREHLGIAGECTFYKRILYPLYHARKLQLIKGKRRYDRRYYWKD